MQSTHGTDHAGSVVVPFSAAQPVESLLRLKAVKARVGLSKSEIYRRMRADPPRFPQAIKVSARVTAWRESEIAEHVRQTILAARPEAA